MKFYEKVWFMWLMLVLFFPVGLILLWKNDEYAKRTKVIITLFIVGVGIFGAANPKNQITPTNQTAPAKQETTKVVNEDEKKQQQEAFKGWYPTFQNHLNDYDQVLGYWKTTMDNLGNGKISRYQAYDNMKKISAGMENVSSRIRNSKIPDTLSKKHKEEIQNGISSLSSAAYYRHKAADDMMEILDKGNFKPSELDGVKTTIQMSEGEMMKGLASIMGVQSELGLLENATK